VKDPSVFEDAIRDAEEDRAGLFEARAKGMRTALLVSAAALERLA
jgi:hypothetical protein